MSFISRLFGHKPAEAAPHTSLHTQLPPQVANVSTSTRRELLRVVLRDTLARHGIPAAWVGAELLTSASRSREPGIHLRLLIKHWEPRLLPCLVALQKHLQHRLERYDPLAPNWLVGISWQFALADESACPELPAPGSWRAEPAQPLAEAGPVLGAGTLTAAAAAGTGLRAAAAPEPTPSTAVTPDPAAEGQRKAQRRADLERMLAQHEAEQAASRRRGPGNAPDFGATQPMFSSTEPAGL